MRLLNHVIALITVLQLLQGQCGGDWTSNAADLLSASGRVEVLIQWDPDGPGPMGQRLLAAGHFERIGRVHCANIAQFDAARRTWVPLGTGLDGGVNCVVALPNGDLIVGGIFRNAGGQPAAGVARWDGTGWSPLGPGLGDVEGITVMAGGEIAACGDFTTFPSPELVAIWDGATWTPVPGISLVSGQFYLLTGVLGRRNGELVLLGRFLVNGQNSSVAAWNGAQWRRLLAAPGLSIARTAKELANGDLLVAGTLVGSGVRRRTSSGWQDIGALGLPAFDFVELGNGEIIATCGTFGVQRWDGANWNPITGQLPAIENWVGPIADWPNPAGGPPRHIVGGRFARLAGQYAQHLAAWDGSTWETCPGTDGSIRGLCSTPGEDSYVWGGFSRIDGIPSAGFARWDGQRWTDASIGQLGNVVAVAARGDGTVFVTDGAGMHMGNPGQGWTPMAGSSPSMRPFVRSNGEVIACDGVSIYRWDGSQWIVAAAARGFAKANHPNGQILLIGAQFPGSPVGRIVLWDGANSWLDLDPLGALFPVDADAGADGSIYAATPNGVYVRTLASSTWTQLTSDETEVLEATPSGEIIAAGAFGARVIRGTQVGEIGSGCRSDVRFVDVSGSGETYVVERTDGGQSLSVHVSQCPPTVIDTVPGCPGATGPARLRAESRPWIGAEYRASVSGFALGDVVVEMMGVAGANIPLRSIIASAGTTCAIGVDPVEYTLLLPAMVRTTAIAIPNQPSLLGFAIRHQAIGCSLGSGLSIRSAAVTNTLQATVGAGF